MNEKCKHDKVYSDQVLLSDPPQYQWICRKCLQTGTSRDMTNTPSLAPITGYMLNEYNYLLQQKKKQEAL